MATQEQQAQAHMTAYYQDMENNIYKALKQASLLSDQQNPDIRALVVHLEHSMRALKHLQRQQQR